jgi:hypothetical protein
MINQSNKVLNNITKLVNQDYQYGFPLTLKRCEKLNENTIRLISQRKKQVFY